MEKQITLLPVDLGTNGIAHFSPEDDVWCRDFNRLQLPEQISLIPALEGMLELETLIREMASPTSSFKPLGCYLLDEFHTSHLVFRFSRFEANLVPHNAQMRYEQFFNLFIAFLSAQSLPKELRIEIMIRYTFFGVQGFNGFSAKLKVYGKGESPDRAREVADNGYANFRRFINGSDIKYHFG